MRNLFKSINWSAMLFIVAILCFLTATATLLFTPSVANHSTPSSEYQITQLKKELATLEARNKELKELRGKEQMIFTNQIARNEYIFIKNDSLISLMGSDSTIELLTINLSQKVRNEWGYHGGNNDTTSKANK